MSGWALPLVVLLLGACDALGAGSSPPSQGHAPRAAAPPERQAPAVTPLPAARPPAWPAQAAELGSPLANEGLPPLAASASGGLPQPAAGAEQSRRPKVDPSRGLHVRSVGALPTVPVEGVGRLIAGGAATVVVDLEDGTRVTADAGTRLWAFALAKSLLLISGELQVTRVSDAQRAGPARVRIASLAGVLELNPGAELALRVELRTSAAPIAYRTQLSLARGSASWISQDERAGARAALIAGEPLPKPAAGLQWLSLPAGQQARVARDRRLQALRQVAVSADLDQLLDAALSEQQALRQRGHALLAQVSPRHAALAKLSRDASVPTRSGSARAYQRELVEHAQRREAQADRLLFAAERSLLRALAECGSSEPSTCPSLRVWSERFAARAADLL